MGLVVDGWNHRESRISASEETRARVIGIWISITSREREGYVTPKAGWEGSKRSSYRRDEHCSSEFVGNVSGSLERLKRRGDER